MTNRHRTLEKIGGIIWALIALGCFATASFSPTLGLWMPFAVPGLAFGLWTIFFPPWQDQRKTASQASPSPPRAGER